MQRWKFTPQRDPCAKALTLAATSSLMVSEVLLSLHRVNQKNHQRKAILSLRAAGGSNEAVKGVLRHIAAPAESIRPAQVEESTES